MVDDSDAARPGPDDAPADADADAGPGGFRDGMESSRGDPRVLLVLNLVLSTLLAWTVVGGLSLVDVAAFSARNVAALALVLFALTYLAVLR